MVTKNVEPPHSRAGSTEFRSGRPSERNFRFHCVRLQQYSRCYDTNEQMKETIKTRKLTELAIAAVILKQITIGK